MNNLLYSKNISLFFKMNIKEALQSFSPYDEWKELAYTPFTIDDADRIIEFYHQAGRKDYSIEHIQFEYDNGTLFHGVEKDGKIIAGMLVHSEYVYSNAPSFLAFYEKRKEAIILNSDSVYSSHNYVISNARGQHLYTFLLYNVLSYYKDIKKDYVLMTGINNYKMIKSSFFHKGRLFGIIQSSLVLKLFRNKHEYYMDKEEKCWENVPIIKN